MTDRFNEELASEAIIRLEHVAKHYQIYAHDFDRIREIFTGKSQFKHHVALEDVSLSVKRGEVVGVIGRNGAGKSTLLKILANTLQPTSGSLSVTGRVAALLELGASFHPEMTGHDNIYLNCSIQGMTKAETDAVYEDIVNFSGIGDYIHRPVKTYSSGMFIRLAFSISTHIDPDILIIDEALSVGDGIFARRSFDRIMNFKNQGKTIFFCSHSLYQVEALCDRVIWIDKGQIRNDGLPAEVITEYSDFLMSQSIPTKKEEIEVAAVESVPVNEAAPRIRKVAVTVDGLVARSHKLTSGASTLEIDVSFYPGQGLPMPSLAVTISTGDGTAIASAGTVNDGVTLKALAPDTGAGKLRFEHLPLLKGNYYVDVYLMCEEGIHIYECARQVTELNVEQKGLERGFVTLPHEWLVP